MTTPAHHYTSHISKRMKAVSANSPPSSDNGVKRRKSILIASFAVVCNVLFSIYNKSVQLRGFGIKSKETMPDTSATSRASNLKVMKFSTSVGEQPTAETTSETKRKREREHHPAAPTSPVCNPVLPTHPIYHPHCVWSHAQGGRYDNSKLS